MSEWLKLVLGGLIPALLSPVLTVAAINARLDGVAEDVKEVKLAQKELASDFGSRLRALEIINASGLQAAGMF